MILSMEPTRVAWVPYDATDDEVEQLNVLREIDEFLATELIKWTIDFFINSDGHASSSTREDSLREAQIALQYQLGANIGQINWNAVRQQIWNLRWDQLLRLVDFLLARPAIYFDLAAKLETTLRRSHSRYCVRVQDSKWRLGTVAPEALTAVLESATGDAHKHLRAAFNHVYELDPNPSAAYESALKALEAAAGPVIQPKAGRTRLGTMYSTLKSGGAVVDLPLSTTDNTDMDTPGVLREMLRAIMVGQTDRHGAGKPVPVTIDQAKSVVLLVTALVPMFQDGLITNTKPPKGS